MVLVDGAAPKVAINRSGIATKFREDEMGFGDLSPTGSRGRALAFPSLCCLGLACDAREIVEDVAGLADAFGD